MSREPQQRTVLKVENGHLIGGPQVVVDRHESKALVYVLNRPWGLQNTDKEFLNPLSPRVDAYAADLLGRLRLKAEREFQRKERVAEARRIEREGGAA